MRKQQLRYLLEGLQHEVRLTASPPAGEDANPVLRHLLAKWQETLLDSYPWQMFSQTESIQLQTAGRFYLPTDVAIDRIQDVFRVISGSSRLMPLPRGIDAAQYAISNALVGETRDPVERWAVRWFNNDLHIEVWPAPQTNQGLLFVRGRVPVPPLVDPDDLAIMDDKLLVLFAAADYLESIKRGAGQTKLAEAQARLDALKRMDHSGE